MKMSRLIYMCRNPGLEDVRARQGWSCRNSGEIPPCNNILVFV